MQQRLDVGNRAGAADTAYYLQLKYCWRQCAGTLLPLPGQNHLQNLTQNVTF